MLTSLAVAIGWGIETGWRMKMAYDAAQKKAKKLGGTYEATYSNGRWDAVERNYNLKGIGMYGATIGCD
jgi:hypothetical protein